MTETKIKRDCELDDLVAREADEHRAGRQSPVDALGALITIAEECLVPMEAVSELLGTQHESAERRFWANSLHTQQQVLEDAVGAAQEWFAPALHEEDDEEGE